MTGLPRPDRQQLANESARDRAGQPRSDRQFRAAQGLLTKQGRSQSGSRGLCGCSLPHLAESRAMAPRPLVLGAPRFPTHRKAMK